MLVPLPPKSLVLSIGMLLLIDGIINGIIDSWYRRREGITYRKNEMFIDTLESVNLLISQTGAVLRSEVVGKIVMKAFLTGMPECRFGLNDKLLISNEKKAKGNRRGKGTGVEIDDCSFHRCVRLGQFDQDRTITFIPPDGEFELMKYRVTENINLPFRILPVYEEIVSYLLCNHMQSNNV